MIKNLVDGLIHHDSSKKVKGTVVMMKKNALDFTDLAGSLTDKLFEALGQKVSLQLISSVQGDPGKSLFRTLNIYQTCMLCDQWAVTERRCSVK